MAVSRAQAVVNGVTINLSYDGTSKKWTGSGTAPTTSSYTKGGFYNVKITAWDDAGNEATVDASNASLGSALKLVVKELTAPTMAFTYPSASARITSNKPTITWTVTDNDSGVNQSSIGITIDSGTKVTGSSIMKTAISGGYSCSYTPGSSLSDGSHTIKIDASDNDGDAATQKSVTFIIDTVPPTLNITTPNDGIKTNKTSITVSGTTNDVTSSPVTLTVKLNSGNAEAVTVNNDGSFSKDLTLADGANTITITAKDSAGKTTTIVRNVTLDTHAPAFSNIVITPNPVNVGVGFTVSVTITD